MNGVDAQKTTRLTVSLAPGLSPAVVTVTGPDHPGVSAEVFRILADHDAQLLDVEQSNFRGNLNLAAYIGYRPETADHLRDELTGTMAERGMAATVDLAEEVQSSRGRSTHVVVVLGDPVTAADVSAIGQALAEHGANIDRIRGIADYPVTGLEMKVTVENPAPGGSAELRESLAAVAHGSGVDIAIQRAGLANKTKRLICFDVDSTLIQQEVIELLAAHAGREAEVAEVTARAMRGELDFSESLHERVKALAGLDASVIDEVVGAIELSPGARTTIRTLKRLGYRTGAVSGGFIQVLEPLARDLGLDFYRANTLEIVDGVLTGRVTGQIIDREVKAESLKEFAWSNGIALNQTVAVGDGANDIAMLSVAGLGIAFNAKPALREVADASVNHPFLDEVLFMLGISREEIDLADLEDGTYRRVPLEN
jgi:phosphoserine phosphatase